MYPSTRLSYTLFSLLGLVCTTASPLAQPQDRVLDIPDSLGGIKVLHGAELDRLISSVRPTAQEEQYLQVPWRTDICKALSEAQEQKKPLFIWSMDGHPLGWC
jgi:hypothetical protein